jgi:isopenicillin N synthase-like dioxygenase
MKGVHMSVLTIDYDSTSAPSLFTQSMKNTGFAVIRNHPIPIDLIEKAYLLWKDFFFSEMTTKEKYLYHKNKQDGYFPFRSENAKDNKISDLKEFYHVYHGGRIPENLRHVSLKIYDALEKLSVELLQWIENELPANITEQLSMPLKEMIKNSAKTLLRILHYPPLDEKNEEGAIRAAPHEDINLITLLPAATAPGLEVLDATGQWHRVSCDPGSIVVNVGDMLQMCTEHYYRSTTHRVINPDNEEKKNSRFSMPLFLHPRPEVRLSKSYTALEYLHQRLREIGIY